MNAILYEKIELNIPNEFQKQALEDMNIYFENQNMDYVYVMEEKKAIIGVIRTKKYLRDSDVENQITAYQQMYSRMAPGFVKGQLKRRNVSGKTIAVMTYKSNAPTRDLFNILVVLSLDEQEILMSFSSDMQDAKSYMPSFINIIESITFIEG